MWIKVNDELYHHGILGQKWGKKSGPPYPLDASKHTAAEKKAGWRKSLDDSNIKGKKKSFAERNAEAKAKLKEEKESANKKKLINKATKYYVKGNIEKGIPYEIKAYRGDIRAAIADRGKQAKYGIQMAEYFKSRSSYLDQKYKTKEIDKSGYEAMKNYYNKNIRIGENTSTMNLKVINALSKKIKD